MVQLSLNACYVLLDTLFGKIFGVVVLPEFVVYFIPRAIYYGIIINMYLPLGLLITLALSCVVWRFTLMFVSAVMQTI